MEQQEKNKYISKGIRLNEESVSEKKKEALITIIKAGESKNDRVYTLSALKKMIPMILENKKIFFDHLSDTGESTRSIKDWAATVKEAKLKNECIEAKIKVHDEWLWKMMREAPEEIGVSIDALGIVEKNENDKNIVKDILKLNSIDFVTKAAAGGKLLSVLESENALLESERRFSERIVEALKYKDDKNAKEYIAYLIKNLKEKYRYKKEEEKKEIETEKINKSVEKTLSELHLNEGEKEPLRKYLKATAENAENEEKRENELKAAVKHLFEWQEKLKTNKANEKNEEKDEKALSKLQKAVMRINNLNPENKEDIKKFKSL